MKNFPERNPQDEEDQESMDDEQRPSLPLMKKQHHHHNPNHEGSSAETDYDVDDVSSSCPKKAMQESQIAHKESPSSKKLKIGGTGSVLVQKKLAADKRMASVEDDENVDQSRVPKDFTSKKIKIGGDPKFGDMFSYHQTRELQNPRKPQDESTEDFTFRWGHTRKRSAGSSVKLGEFGFGAKLPFNDAKNNTEAGFGTKFATSRKYDLTGTKEAMVEKNKQLVCKFCHREFRNHQALGGHLKMHTNEPVNDKYVCKTCHSEFDSYQGLGGHMSMHGFRRRAGKQAPIAHEVREARGHKVGETGVDLRGHRSVSGSRRVAVQEAPAAPEVEAVSDHEDGQSDEEPEAGVKARGRGERGFDLNELPDEDLDEDA